jgi:NADPH:quinone reductase-like Zn-dependent oxidoreductase
MDLASMRAVRFDRFGPAEELRVVALDVPTPGRGEVLVHVHAAGVGGGEPQIRAGQLRRVMRLRPPSGTGNEFAGEVAAIGPEVNRLQPGDRVWGVMPHLTFGSMADYVAVPEELVAAAPEGLDPVEAAALPSCGTTTLTALVDKAALQKGERVLIRGASGGLGSLAVQLAKAMDAHVTALAGARNLGWVSDLGADVALDYRGVEPSALGQFDVVFDSVGTDMPRYRRLLTPRGRFIALAADTDHLVASFAFIARGTIARRRRVLAFSNSPTVRELDQLRNRVEAGDMRPVVDSVFPLHQVGEAHRRLEAGGIRGKYVIDLRRTGDAG